jgi:hypothetical protein
VRSAGVVQRLVHEFDALPSTVPPTFRCAIGWVGQVNAQLAYPGGHNVQIGVLLNGCTAYNGAVARYVTGRPQPRAGTILTADLERLVHWVNQ